jgi:hypothetical protein
VSFWLLREPYKLRANSIPHKNSITNIWNENFLGISIISYTPPLGYDPQSPSHSAVIATDAEWVSEEIAGHTLKGTGARNDGERETASGRQQHHCEVPKGRNFHNRRQAKRSLRWRPMRVLRTEHWPHSGQAFDPCARQNAWDMLSISLPNGVPTSVEGAHIGAPLRGLLRWGFHPQVSPNFS